MRWMSVPHFLSNIPPIWQMWIRIRGPKKKRTRIRNTHWLPEGVPVFVEEWLYAVPDLARVVLDPELQGIHTRPKYSINQRTYIRRDRERGLLFLWNDGIFPYSVSCELRILKTLWSVKALINSIVIAFFVEEKIGGKVHLKSQISSVN